MSNDVRILIVENEFMISEDIAMRLSDFGYTVSGIAPSASDAVEILKQGNTDLALIDINIDGDVDGIELAKVIYSDFNIPFIFLTSLASKTIVERAQETHPSAYLLKPYNDRQVQIAIDMALVNYSQKVNMDITQITKKGEAVIPAIVSMKGGLFLKKDFHFERVMFDDIYYLSAEGNYTTIYTKSSRYMYSNVLKSFEEKLPSDIFIRVHRSFIININAITGFEGNYLHVNNEKIPVTRAVREILFKSFNVV